MTNNIIDGVLSRRDIKKSLHVYKQIFGTFASCLLSMSSGLTFGYTGVLLPQLQDDKDFPYDKSFDSWIASISPLAMIFGCFFAGAMSDGLGRKTSIIILTLPYLSGWFCMAFAKGNVLMLAGRFITGMCTGAVRPSIMVYIGEITEPKYRAVALFCPTLAVHIGAFISHTVGNIFYWRTSCLVFGLPNIICFIILMFLKESPLWLISKGKTEQGAKAFKVFRGEGDAAEKELATVLESRKEKPEKMTLNIFIQTILSKAFMKALFTVFVLFSAMQLCGVNMISFYAQDVFKRTFSGEINPYKLMLCIDGVRIGTAASVCLFAKFFPRKTSYLTCGFGTALCLGALVVYLYISPVGFVWLAVTIMVMYVMVASAMTSLSWSFIAEIFPGNVRGFGSGVSSGISFSLLFIAVKLSPGIMVTFGETAMYAGFGVITIVASVLLSFILPETNGKTLQDIENNLYKMNNKTKTPPETPSTHNTV